MVHRAATLVVLMALALLMVAVLLVGGIQRWNNQSFAALLFVIAVTAAAGVAFSWRRYFGGRHS